MGWFFYVLAAIIGLMGVTMIAFPNAFTKEPRSYFLSLKPGGHDPLLFVFETVSFLFLMLFSQFPERFKVVAVRIAGGLVILAAAGVGFVGTNPNMLISKPDPPVKIAQPQAAAPAPAPTPTPAPTEADADAFIAQASTAWRSGDIEGALGNARQARAIIVHLSGESHPKVVRIDQMLAAAQQQLAGAQR